MSEVGRNEPCLCGSGKKFKKCCLLLEQELKARPLPHEMPFTTELRPDIDAKVDSVLQGIEAGQIAGAEGTLKALLNEYPDYHMTNYGMGVYWACARGNPKEALSFFENAVELFPIFAEAHFNLAGCYVKTFEIEKAVEAYRSAIRYSQNGDGINRMAGEKLRGLEESVVRTSSSRSLDDYLKNQRLFGLAFQALSEKRFEDSIRLFKMVIANEPKHPQSYGNLALAYAGVGKKRDAMACLDHALEIDPNYEPAIVNRAMIGNMIEGQPAIQGEIREINYYTEYGAGRNKSSYVKELIDDSVR